MATTYAMLLGRFYLASNQFNVTHDAGEPDPDSDTITTTAGHYYPYGYTGESTSQLLEHLQTLIRASSLGTSLASATVSLAPATGLVTIDFQTGVNIGVTWTDTDLRDVLGFTGNLSGATSYTATNEMRYIWRPDKPVSRHPVDRDQVWAPESSTRTVVASSGASYAIRGASVNRATLVWRLLAKARVAYTPGTTVYESFTNFFDDVLDEGQSLRYLIDRTSYTSTSDYVEALPDTPKGLSLLDLIQRSQERYDGLWDVTLPLTEYA